MSATELSRHRHCDDLVNDDRSHKPETQAASEVEVRRERVKNWMFAMHHAVAVSKHTGSVIVQADLAERVWDGLEHDHRDGE